MYRSSWPVGADNMVNLTMSGMALREHCIHLSKLRNPSVTAVWASTSVVSEYQSSSSKKAEKNGNVSAMYVRMLFLSVYSLSRTTFQDSSSCIYLLRQQANLLCACTDFCLPRTLLHFIGNSSTTETRNF